MKPHVVPRSSEMPGFELSFIHADGLQLVCVFKFWMYQDIPAFFGLNLVYRIFMLFFANMYFNVSKIRMYDYIQSD